MKARKLVLGVCVLAAITVEAPQVFGKPISSAEVVFGDLTEVFGNAEKRAKYVESVDVVMQGLECETAILAEWGEKEVECVKMAIQYERRAHFLREICKFNAEPLESVRRKMTSLKSDIRIAEKYAEQAKDTFLFKSKKKAQTKILMLQAELSRAKADEKRIMLEMDQNRLVVSNYLDFAQELKKRAGELHKLRVEFLSKLIDAQVDRRSDGIILDHGCLSDSETSIESLEMIAVRALKDVSFENAECHMLNDAAEFSHAIEEALLNQEDSDWPRDMLGNNLDLYNKWKASYRQKPLGYDHKEILLEQTKARRDGSYLGLVMALDLRARKVLLQRQKASS